LTAFARLAQNDPSPVVRLYLASALQRMPTANAWEVATALARHGEDADDHNLPKMIWYGLEPLVAQNPNRALTLAAEAKIPLITRFVARRLVDADAVEPLVNALDQNGNHTVSLLEGLRDGLEGRFDLKAPARWSAISAKLRQADERRAQLALQIAQRFGDTEATQKSLATLKNAQAPAEQRRQALQAIAARKRPELVAELPALLDVPALRADAIRAMADYDHEPFGKLLLTRYNSLSPAERQQAVQTLSTRPRYGWLLTQAIKDQRVPKRDVPPYVARQLLRVVGSGFVEVWGPIEVTGVDNQAYGKYQRMLNERALAKADAVKGEGLFQRTCGSCHKLYGKGGDIGPDLTGSNRGNVDYILFNVLNPSGEIQDDYKLVVVTTRDGRTYSGNVIAENERQLTMRIVGQDAVVLNKSAIQSREVTPVSLMPQGLFDNLTETEVLDLVKYLRTQNDVSQTGK